MNLWNFNTTHVEVMKENLLKHFDSFDEFLKEIPDWSLNNEILVYFFWKKYDEEREDDDCFDRPYLLTLVYISTPVISTMCFTINIKDEDEDRVKKFIKQNSNLLAE